MAQKTGVGHYTEGLIRSMAAAQPDTRFIGYFYNFFGRKQPPASPRASNISYKPIYHLPGPAVNLLRRFGIEVPIEVLTGVHADFILYPNFLGQPSLFGTPNAPVIHDLVYYDHPEYGSDKSVRDLTRFVPKTLRRASFVITVSEFTKQRTMDVYHVPSDTFVKTFIPPTPIRLLADERVGEIITEQGITKPYVLFVGTMEPRKNIPNLLEAYTLLPGHLRQSHSLVLAGKIDWKYQETKAKLEGLQAGGYDIHYLGYVDDDTRAALYQGARLFAMAPHYEGFGMQTLEAMQYGVQCAVSDIPVLREVGGEATVYFDQEDPQSIAAVITACLDNPPPDPSLLREYVASQPDWEAVGKLVLTKIDQAVNERSTK